MALPESRFFVDIVILLLDKMLFGHAEQSELKLIGLSLGRSNGTPSRCFETSIALFFLD